MLCDIVYEQVLNQAVNSEKQLTDLDNKIRAVANDYRGA